MHRRGFLAGMTAGAFAAGLGAARAQETLRGLATNGRVVFGTAVDEGLLADPRYAELVKSNCDVVVPRNALKWKVIHPREGQFRFDGPDRIAQFAEENGLGMRGHTLVWHSAPGWVTSMTNANKLKVQMARHIRTTVSRYVGRIQSWDVVNEPFEYDTADMRNSVFLDLLGEEYIDRAFIEAREQDANAQLIINETHLCKKGEIYSAKREAMLGLLDRLISRKVPIDGVGLQGHFRPGLDELDVEATAIFSQALKDRGLSVLITEMDATCRFVSRIPGFSDADYASLFNEFITAAGSAGNLTSVTMWGLTTYGMEPTEEPEPNASCEYRIKLFDRDSFEPLPTFDAVRTALKGLAG